MGNIMIEAQDVWDFYKDNQEELAVSMHEIANYYDFGVNIYITAMNTTPEIIVEADDEEVYREAVYDEVDCKDTAERIYADYLTIAALTMLGLCNSDEEIQEKIDDREAEIDAAVYQFYTDLLGNDISSTEYDDNLDEILDDMKEHFLEYMARKWGIGIYRPMILEDENGEEFFEEYPYGCMVFEDEGNPIYDK